VLNNDWKELIIEEFNVEQGYLNSSPDRTVRIRLSSGIGTLTIKSKTIGISKDEFEYIIPFNDAVSMLSLCERPALSKTRYIVDYEGYIWEIDVFHGENEGLVIAEVELNSESDVPLKPDWIGEQVSLDPRYFNSQLSLNPYKNW